jgi:hypothetical protein
MWSVHAAGQCTCGRLQVGLSACAEPALKSSKTGAATLAIAAPTAAAAIFVRVRVVFMMCSFVGREPTGRAQ